MGKLWLILEPYVYISTTAKAAIVYNTLNHKLYKSENKNILKILKRLNSLQNFYVLPISDSTKEISEVQLFIQWLRDTFSGDLIPKEIVPVRPLQIVPNIYLKQSSYEYENPESIYYNNINQSLHELFLYINSICSINCNFCGAAHKQILYCKKEIGKELDYRLIKKILEELKETSLQKIHLLGGNILKYSDLVQLLEFLSKTSYIIIYHVHIRNLADELSIQNLLYSNAKLNVKVFVDDIDEEIELRMIKIENLFKEKVQFDFIVQNNEDCNYVFSNKINIKNYTIIPFYNRTNIEFFEDNVFLTEKDFRSIKHGMSDILKKRIYNINFWGKLIVDADGSVYSSFNLPKIGKIKIDESFLPILAKTMDKNSSWRLIRKLKKPCMHCAYNFLCPPISDYELTINKTNLCHLG